MRSLERGWVGTLERVLRLSFLLVFALATACGEKKADDEDDVSGLVGGKGGAGGRGPMAGAGGLGASGMAGAGLASGVECPFGQNACGTTCTNLTSDPAHCGSCATVCPTGTACQAGTCMAQCGIGQALCGTACKTIVSDPANCGGCGMACPAGQFCVSGACAATCPLQTCDAVVGEECADVKTNPSHCGGCGAACLAGQSCVEGKCLLACPTGQTACGTVCADLMTNAASCGACGSSCPAGQPCIAGHCGCQAGATLCSGACADMQSDAANCGACGKACPTGQVCQAGVCAAGCSAGLMACNGGCVDTATSAANCGACGTACPAAQVCQGGKCACQNGGMLCGGACVSTQTDKANCGACGTKCGGEQTCTAGACTCSGGLTACGDACVDTKTSNDHCGNCNAPCSGGESCVAGECQCPSGQMACSGVCADTMTSDAHCGGCGMPCATGQLCVAGKCSGAGGVGADGCTGGLARNITLSRIDALQTVAVGIMEDGMAVAQTARNSDVVAGKETVFRIFVTPGSGWSGRELSARVTIVNGDTSEEFYTKKTVSMASDEDDTGSTIQVTVPAEQIVEDVTYHVELVECSDAGSGDAAVPRFPAEDDADLAVRVTGGLKVRIIPLKANNRTPPTDEESLKPYKDIISAMYPIGSLTIDIGDELDIDYPIDWNGALDQVRAKRQQDGPDADIYYYGLLKPTDTFNDFCGRGCTAGIGYVSSQSQAQTRVAVGIGFPGNQSAITMAHEVGHNHGRNHAPCVPQGGSISGVDNNYPYSGGSIGVWGYDLRGKSLVNPMGITDIMGYCNNQWISDYTYDAIVNRVATVNASVRAVVNPDTLSQWRVLLLDDRGPRWGLPIEEPAPPTGTAEVAEVFGDDGDVIDYALVYRTEVSDIGAASILVPPPKKGWYAIGVSGSTPHPFAAPVAIRKGY